MSTGTESWPVRAITLALLVAGSYAIYLKLPPLLEGTPLAEFPVVTSVMAQFAYLTLANLLLWATSSLITKPAAQP
jgi:hypothetical protein